MKNMSVNNNPRASHKETAFVVNPEQRDEPSKAQMKVSLLDKQHIRPPKLGKLHGQTTIIGV